MTQMHSLLNMANQFVTDRNWWQFHNPKNDSLNIVTEAGELAELFVLPVPENRVDIADEIADVLFGTMLFTKLTQIDLAQKISLIANKQTNKQTYFAG